MPKKKRTKKQPKGHAVNLGSINGDEIKALTEKLDQVASKVRTQKSPKQAPRMPLAQAGAAPGRISSVNELQAPGVSPAESSVIQMPAMRVQARAEKSPEKTRMLRIRKLNENKAIVDRLVRKGALKPDGTPVDGFERKSLRPNERRVYNYRLLNQKQMQGTAQAADQALGIAGAKPPM